MALPTLWLVDGFEHGLATATSGNGVFDGISSTPTISTSVPANRWTLLRGRCGGGVEASFLHAAGHASGRHVGLRRHLPTAFPAQTASSRRDTLRWEQRALRFGNSSDRVAVSNDKTANQVLGPNPKRRTGIYRREVTASGGTCVRWKGYCSTARTGPRHVLQLRCRDLSTASLDHRRDGHGRGDDWVTPSHRRRLSQPGWLRGSAALHAERRRLANIWARTLETQLTGTDITNSTADA